MDGLLIAIEGLDQSGKETQARRLRAWFEARGRQVESLAFPDYATPIGQEIWKGLHGERDFGPDTIQLLLIANRHEWKPRIQEWLAAGRVVICDRYLASSVAYGEAQGLDQAPVLRDVVGRDPERTVQAGRRQARGHHLVEDQHDLVLVAGRANDLPIIRRRNERNAPHGFGDHGGDDGVVDGHVRAAAGGGRPGAEV